MFNHGGVCYVAMPRHVAGEFPRVTLSTAAPVVSGTGNVITPFWPSLDLALAVASEALAGSCTAKLDDLTPSRRARSASTAQVLRLADNGAEDRIAIDIQDRTYLTFTGQIAAGETEIAQGTSGAFAYVTGEPIGMAITSDDPSRALFMRSEEIALNVGRFLSESGGQIAAKATPEEAPAARNTLPLALVSSSVAPVSPEFAPENMLGGGQFVFSPRPDMVFDLRFEPDKIRPLSRLQIISPAGSGHALPKNLILQVSHRDSEGGFVTVSRKQMGSDGIFDTGPMAPRNVRRIRVIVLDAWSTGTIVIDRISAE